MAAKGTLTVKVLGDAKPFENTMGKLGKTAAVAFAAVGTAAVAGAAKSVLAFSDFQGRMNEVFTLLPGISQGAMDQMSGQVKNFSKEFGVLPDKVVPALYQALSAGVPKDNVFEFLETAQMAAKGGVTELETAVDGISSVVNAYGSDVVNATKASDLMFTAVKLGKTNFEQLSSSLSNVTPIASGLGVKFEDVSAGLASLTAKGTPTAEATTQLRSLFVDLSKAGGKTATVFEDMAGKTFQEFIAGGGNTADALEIMQEAAKKSGVQIQDLFGSVEAGSAALSLSSGDSFTNNIDAMGESAGATQAAFDQMMTGLGPIFDKIKANVAVFLIDIGEKLAPHIETAMARLGAAFSTVSEWWSANGPKIIGRIEKVRDSIMDWIDEVRPHIESWVKDVLGNVSKWWEDHGPTIIDIAEDLRDGLIDAFEKITDTIRFVMRNWDRFKIAIGIAVAIMIPHFVALGAAAVASSIKQAAAWVVARIGAIKAAIVHSAQVAIMIAKWALLGVKSLLHAGKVVAGWVMTGAGAVAAVAVMVAQSAIFVAKWAFMGVQALLHAAKVAAAWLIAMGPIGLVIAAVIGLVVVIVKNWDTIKEVIGKAWDWVKRTTSDVWEKIKSGVSTAVGAVVGFVKGIPGRIASTVSSMWNGIKDGIEAARKFVDEKILAIVGFVAAMPGKINTAASGMWDGIKNAFKGAINWIIRKWNDLSFSLPAVDIPGIGKIGGGTLRTPNIPTLATGGVVSSPTLALVGDAGRGNPEIVAPQNMLRQMMQDVMGTAGPQVIQLVVDGRVLAQTVNDHNADRNRRNPARR